MLVQSHTDPEATGAEGRVCLPLPPGERSGCAPPIKFWTFCLTMACLKHW